MERTTTKPPWGDLPPPTTVRWTASRKAQVVRAVRDGTLTRQAACGTYSLSEEELAIWERGVDNDGHRGLFVTKRGALQARRDGR